MGGADTARELQAELKGCYQSTKKLLQDKELQRVKVPRTDFSCLASAVLSRISVDVASILRECLRTASGNDVEVPRNVLMVLMKSVADRLANPPQVGSSGEPPAKDGSSGEPPATPVKDGAASCEPSATPQKDLGGEAKQSRRDSPPMAKREASNWQGRVLVIGAGATGACTALRLRNVLGNKARIVVWEKARGAGGRMSTNRQDSIGVRADMGAPYLSLDGDDPDCAAVADMLVKSKVCADVPSEWLSGTPERPSKKGWRHLAGTEGGVNDALKKIFEEANAEVCYEHRVASLDQQRGQWRAKPFSGPPTDFDAVILAVPGCGIGGDNLNKIHGSWEHLISREQNQQLQGVQHDQRWAFALFFPSDCADRCDSFFGSRAVEKVVDDGVVHLLCYQSRKVAKIDGPRASRGIAIVAHTTVEWARRNSRANGRDNRLLDEVSERVKSVLGLKRSRLLASKVITWKQCHVTRPIRSDSPDGPCMLLSSDPPLLLAGDYFTQSNFGGCSKSGFAAADTLSDILTSSDGGTTVGGKRKMASSSTNSSNYKRSRGGW